MLHRKVMITNELREFWRWREEDAVEKAKAAHKDRRFSSHFQQRLEALEKLAVTELNFALVVIFGMRLQIRLPEDAINLNIYMLWLELISVDKLIRSN